jgi:hypothetical protein
LGLLPNDHWLENSLTRYTVLVSRVVYPGFTLQGWVQRVIP